MNTQQNPKMIDALGISTRQIAALLVTGHRMYTQGRLNQARKIFEGLVALDSSSHYVHGILGSIYQRQNKYDLALLRYNNAIALFPDDTNSLTNRGEIFVQFGRFQEAAEDFKKAIALDPDRKDPAANRARLLVSLVQDAIALTKQDGLAKLRSKEKTKCPITEELNNGNYHGKIKQQHSATAGFNFISV